MSAREKASKPKGYRLITAHYSGAKPMRVEYRLDSFTSSAALIAHYRAVKARLRSLPSIEERRRIMALPSPPLPDLVFNSPPPKAQAQKILSTVAIHTGVSISNIRS